MADVNFRFQGLGLRTARSVDQGALIYYASAGITFILNETAKKKAIIALNKLPQQPWYEDPAPVQPVLDWLNNNGSDTLGPGSPSATVLRIPRNDVQTASSVYAGLVNDGTWINWIPPSNAGDPSNEMHARGDGISIAGTDGCGLLYFTGLADVFLLNPRAVAALPKLNLPVFWENDKTACAAVYTYLDTNASPPPFQPADKINPSILKIARVDANALWVAFIGCVTGQDNTWAIMLRAAKTETPKS